MIPGYFAAVCMYDVIRTCISPRPGMPSFLFSWRYLSVSVICKDSGLGDALSTALFCMEKEKGLSLVEAMPGVEVLWVSDDGSKTASSGWNNYVKK